MHGDWHRDRQSDLFVPPVGVVDSCGFFSKPPLVAGYLLFIAGGRECKVCQDRGNRRFFLLILSFFYRTDDMKY